MIEIDLRVQHHFSAGVYAKQMLLPAGHYAETHAHLYDHMSILASGSVVVTIDGISAQYVSPAVIHIGAGKKHRIDAVEDAVWFCVHATEETDAQRIDRVLVMEH